MKLEFIAWHFAQLVISFRVIYGFPDKNPPVIVSATNPESVAAGSMFSVNLTMTDVSGIAIGPYSYMNVRASADSGSTYMACTTTALKLESGTVNDGVWSLSCIIPESSPNYSYDCEIHISDTVGNQAELNIPKAFVLTGGTAPDYIPPKIVKAELSDTELNVGDTLTITAHVTDSQSGVNYLQVYVYDSYFTYLTLCTGKMTQTSGNTADGYWSFDCVIPASADDVNYDASIYAYDNQNNVGFTTLGFKVNPSRLRRAVRNLH